MIAYSMLLFRYDRMLNASTSFPPQVFLFAGILRDLIRDQGFIRGLLYEFLPAVACGGSTTLMCLSSRKMVGSVCRHYCSRCCCRQDVLSISSHRHQPNRQLHYHTCYFFNFCLFFKILQGN